MKKYRFVLLPFASALIIVLTSALFALPKIKTIVEFKGGLGKEREKLSRLTEKSTLLEGLDEYELGKRVAMVEEALPSKKAVAEILVALSFVAEESNASLVGFDISPGELFPEKFEEIIFKATFEGPRDDVEKILRRVNQVLPVTRVISFNIKETKTTLEIESYFSPLPKSLGKIDTPLPKISKEEEGVYRKIAQFESFEKRLPVIPVGKKNLFSEF